MTKTVTFAKALSFFIFDLDGSEMLFLQPIENTWVEFSVVKTRSNQTLDHKFLARKN